MTPQKENKKEVLPCPHGRLPINGQDGWKHCPHCLGLNSIKMTPTEKLMKEFDEDFASTKMLNGIHVCVQRADTVKSWILQHFIAKEEVKKEIEKMRKDGKVCAYCLDTGLMKVRKMRGSGYDDKRCMWCRDGKDKLDADQLVEENMNYNLALSDLLKELNL